MAFWFYRGLRRGVVTTDYPKSVDAWTEGLPSAPRFDPDRLTPQLADRLAEACPAGAVDHESGELVLDLGRCTGCGLCSELGAPAVVRSGWFLLAATDRASLIKRVPVRGGGDGRKHA